MKYLGILVAFILLSSCATIVNSPYTILEVTSSPDSAIVKLENQPTEYITPVNIPLKRSRNDVTLSVEKDSLYQEIILESKLSPAFTVGNLFSWGIYGYLVDLTNPRKYKYRSNLHVNLNGSINNEIYNGYVNDKKYLKLTLAIPFANNYLIYNGKDHMASQGGWGFEFGMEYYQTPKHYLSFNYGAATDFFLPVHSTIDYIGEFERNSTVYFSVRQNYIYNKLHFGAGLGLVGLKYIKHYTADGQQVNYKYDNQGIAFSGQIQYQFSKRFFAGILYQPLTHVKREGRFMLDYQHFISLKIEFKLPLAHLK